MVLNIVHIYIILLIISMELLYLIVFGNGNYNNKFKIENMTGENTEAISNLASLYNNKNMVVTNLTVTGKLTAPNLETNQINTTRGHDWLRINNGSTGSGKTAIHGNLSVNEVRKGESGLSVGAWVPTIGNGVVQAVNVKTKSLNTPKGHDWLRINDGGADSAGRTAVFGNLSVNTTQNDHSGFVSGSFASVPNGEIHGNHISPNHIKTKTIGIGGWKLGDHSNHLVQQYGSHRLLLAPNMTHHVRGLVIDMEILTKFNTFTKI